MSMPFPVSEKYIRQIQAFPGGADWLRQLPGVLSACAEHWRLTLFHPFDLSYNYVCPAMRVNGDEVVLKIGLPTAEFESERAALQAYAGRGAVRLLDFSAAHNAMLLERVRPGTMLSETVDDVQCTDIAADVMSRLWRPVPAEHPFVSTREWARGLERLRMQFNGGTGPLPAKLVEKAEGLFRDLFASEGETVVLHGDLHHYNILRGRHQTWLALDPKGVVGEREYETGAFLRNPNLDRLDDKALLRLTLRRIDQLCEKLGFNRQRVAAWCYAQDVLSHWWAIEDGTPWTPHPRLAAILDDRI